MLKQDQNNTRGRSLKGRIGHTLEVSRRFLQAECIKPCALLSLFLEWFPFEITYKEKTMCPFFPVATGGLGEPWLGV